MADDASKATSSICAHCKQPATSRCDGCLHAPTYDGSVSSPTFYCNRACQKADWHKHKVECTKMNARKALGRAAVLLQALIYQIRRYASPLQFESLRIDGSVLFLDGLQSNGFEPKLMQRFPVSLGVDRGTFEAALMHRASLEALLYLHNFAKELLDGLGAEIEEVRVIVRHRELHIFPVFPNGQSADSLDPYIHDLYKITLENGEVWAVDTTGAQCGYPSPLCPWNEFEQQRSAEITRKYEFGYVRYNASKKFGKSPMKHMMSRMIEMLDLTGALEEGIPKLAWPHGGNLNIMLRVSDATFRQAKETFLEDFEVHLRQSMRKLRSPEQTAKRKIEVDRQIIQNMSDLDQQEYMAAFFQNLVASIAADGAGQEF